MQNKQNKQKNLKLTKNQHTKSVPNLHSKHITNKNNSPSSSVLREDTDLSISDADTRASTRGSVDGDDSDVESIEGNGKKKLTGFAERINSNTKNLGVIGGARAKYSGVATAILDMIDANNDDYSKENKDDFFTAVRSQMQKSLGSNVTLKDEIWKSEFDRVFQNSSKGRNFLGILERNAVDTKALEEKNLSLQQQIARDKEAQGELQEEAQQALQENSVLKGQVGDVERQLKKEKDDKERLEAEQKKKDEDLRRQEADFENLKQGFQSEIEELKTKMRDSEGKSGTEKSDLQRQRIEREKNDALRKEIEKLNLQNQQSEQEKRSQADLLNAEKLRNDQLQAELETNKGLAEEKEKGQNQPDQQSQQKDITFEPDSAKDKISGRAKEIGRALADNLFIIAAMIGTIMALMSGAAFATIIVATVVPIAGMMVNKGINMIADQIERSQKKKEKAENLERERSPNLSQKLNPDLQNMGQVSTNPEKNGDEELDKQSEGDEESLENESRRGSQNDEYQETELDDAVDGKKSDIGDDIEDSDRTSVKEGDFEDADIQKINDEIGEDDKVIVDFEAKNLNRAAEGRRNLDGTTGKLTTTGEVEFKNPSTIDGLDLDGAIDPMTKINNPGNLTFEEQRAQLKAKVGYSPTLQTSEQVNASETKSDGGIKVQAPEFTEAEQKDKQIAKLLEKRKNIQQEHNKYKATEKILNQKSDDLEKTIKDREAKKDALSEDIMNLQNKMKDAGISDESEELTGIIGFRKTMRQKELEAKLKELELKAKFFELQAVKAGLKLENPKGLDEYRRKKLEEKISKYDSEKLKLEGEKQSLEDKNKEKDGLKNKMQEFKKTLNAIDEDKKKLDSDQTKLKSESDKLKKNSQNITAKESVLEKEINLRKQALKMENERKLQEKDQKELAEKQKNEANKQKEYMRKLQNANEVIDKARKAANMGEKIKNRAYMESANEDELFGLMPQKENIGVNDKDGSKVVDNSAHELLEVLINGDEMDLSGASNTHSPKSFVVDADQPLSSRTASQIQ
jgi:hypothetical protein